MGVTEYILGQTCMILHGKAYMATFILLQLQKIPGARILLGS